MHWAFKYIGTEYQSGGTGPDAFDCWGLVRAVYKDRLNIEIPEVSISQNTNMAAMRSLVGVSWGRVPEGGQIRELDAMSMESPLGKHIGVIVKPDGYTLLLHTTEDTGGIATMLCDIGSLGYYNTVLWRQFGAH